MHTICIAHDWYILWWDISPNMYSIYKTSMFFILCSAILVKSFNEFIRGQYRISKGSLGITWQYENNYRQHCISQVSFFLKIQYDKLFIKVLTLIESKHLLYTCTSINSLDTCRSPVPLSFFIHPHLIFLFWRGLTPLELLGCAILKRPFSSVIWSIYGVDNKERLWIQIKEK